MDSVFLLFINRSWVFVAGRQNDRTTYGVTVSVHLYTAACVPRNQQHLKCMTQRHEDRNADVPLHTTSPPTTTLITDAINTIQYPWRLNDFTKINFLDTGPQFDSMQQSFSSEYNSVGPQPVKKSPTFCGTIFTKPATCPNYKSNQIQPTSNFSSFRTT
jgi:hypothetical protein